MVRHRDEESGQCSDQSADPQWVHGPGHQDICKENREQKCDVKKPREFRTIHISEGKPVTAPRWNSLVTQSPALPLRNAHVYATSHEVISIFQLKPIRSDTLICTYGICFQGAGFQYVTVRLGSGLGSDSPAGTDCPLHLHLLRFMVFLCFKTNVSILTLLST